jgi:Na+-transporting methylmalonyl-CoA/oxaloacetate decarboxylase gamma subunit
MLSLLIFLAELVAICFIGAAVIMLLLKVVLAVYDICVSMITSRSIRQDNKLRKQRVKANKVHQDENNRRVN